MARLIHKMELFQTGKESSKGTGIAADRQHVHPIILEPDFPVERPGGLRGFTSRNTGDDIITARSTKLTFPEFPASYQDMLVFLAMSVEGGVTPVVDGGEATVFESTFERERSEVTDVDTFTVEVQETDGTTAVDREMTFAFLRDWTLKWLPSGLVMFSANGIANKIGASTFTSVGGTPSAVEQIVGKRTKFFLDPLFANVGTTEEGAEVLGATLTFNTGFVPGLTVTSPNTDMSYDKVFFDPEQAFFKLDVTMLAQGAGEFWLTEDAAALAQTPRAIRLENEGEIIAGALRHRLRVDLWGVWEQGSMWISGEQEGQKIVQASFVETTGGMASATDEWIRITLQNLLSTI